MAPTALAVGAACLLASTSLLAWAWAADWQGLTGSHLLAESPWLLATAFGLALASVVQYRQPGHPATYFAVIVGATATGSLLDYLAAAAAMSGWGPWPTAGIVWLGETAVIGSIVAATYLLITFPDGAIERRWERAIMLLAPVALVVPLVLLVVNPVVTTPWWAERPDVASPLHIASLSIDPDAASTAIDLVNVLLLVSAASLIARYRRSDPGRRARIRWVLLPMLVGAVGAISAALLQPPNALVSALVIVVQVTMYVAVALALLAPRRLDPDRVLRRSLVYGVLWLSISGVWAAAAAMAGLTAGRSASIGWAVVVTMVVALLIEPARTRLDRAADRWVFGQRHDHSDVIAQMGRTLASTYQLDSLLPRMSETLRDGLGLQWAEVRLRDGDGTVDDDIHDEPVLVVPIIHDGAELGEVRCGPRPTEPLTPDEVDLVKAFANQAALAVGNVRLARQLADHADELAASRTRLVRAQEDERHRIERNIHDGVQQDLVALISQAGRTKRFLERDPATAERELNALQAGLQRVLDDLRELARGIHPSLLTDRGLLVAVEALAARSPIPTTVRADMTLRDGRLPKEVEAAAYFTVAEAVANTLKHADARHLDVSLARNNGSLVVEVTDDGRGMQHTDGALTTIAERVDAIGGNLTVTSSPGHGTTVRSQLRVEGRPS